jgi:hypothetical protein
MRLTGVTCDDLPVFEHPEDDYNEPTDDDARIYPGVTGPDAMVDRGRMRRDIHGEGLDCDHYLTDHAWYKFVERVA